MLFRSLQLPLLRTLLIQRCDMEFVRVAGRVHKWRYEGKPIDIFIPELWKEGERYE